MLRLRTCIRLASFKCNEQQHLLGHVLVFLCIFVPNHGHLFPIIFILSEYCPFHFHLHPGLLAIHILSSSPGPHESRRFHHYSSSVQTMVPLFSSQVGHPIEGRGLSCEGDVGVSCGER